MADTNIKRVDKNDHIALYKFWNRVQELNGYTWKVRAVLLNNEGWRSHAGKKWNGNNLKFWIHYFKHNRTYIIEEVEQLLSGDIGKDTS